MNVDDLKNVTSAMPKGMYLDARCVDLEKERDPYDEANWLIQRENDFYHTLIKEIKQSGIYTDSFEAQLEEDPSTPQTPLVEKLTYFVAGKIVAQSMLRLLSVGAFIAVDPDALHIWNSKEKHLKAINSFVEEVEAGYINNDAFFLKLPQVQTGLEHLVKLGQKRADEYELAWPPASEE